MGPPAHVAGQVIINPRRINPIVNDCRYRSPLPNWAELALTLMAGGEETMQFQVLSSTIRYRHPLTPGRRGVTLEFRVFPCQREQLHFSDGSRLMGCDLSEAWGAPLTIGDVARKLKESGYKDIDEQKFAPLDTTVSVTEEDWRTVRYLKDQKDDGFVCGYAQYENSEHAFGLNFWLSVEKDVFRDLLQARLDLGGRTTLNIDFRALGKPSAPEIWDLKDESDCGQGDCRVVQGFSLERETPHFSRDPQAKRAEVARVEDKREIEKLRSLLADVLSIEKETVRRNQLFGSAILLIGILALIRLYF